MIGKQTIFDAVIMVLLVQITPMEIAENCTCGYYSDTDVGPYCLKWSEEYPSYCYLAGREKAKNCPGAEESKRKNIYWTKNELVCNKSIPPQHVPLSLSARKPFEIREIIEICLYSLTILVGTVGNALVMKHFASANVSGRPGSRFVIVLAGVDFLSSIWIPCFFIVRLMYSDSSFFPSDFGESACRILQLYPPLLYSTSWLLLAISLERARAIFRPFAEKLRAKFIIFCSTIILLGSFVLSLNYGLGLTYKSNTYLYVDGTIYGYSTCTLSMSAEDFFVDALIMYSLGIWLPMILIPIVYILTFLRLKKQAKVRQQNSTHDSNGQLSRISHTFTIVLVVFYVCYIPGSITYSILRYDLYVRKTISNDVYLTCHIISNFLTFSSSCLNPIIYSKIHVKIYKAFRRFITSCVAKSPFETARQAQQPITPNNMVPLAHLG